MSNIETERLSRAYKEKAKRLKTWSGIDLQRAYSPQDIATDYVVDLGDPGQPPYTRGIHEDMYRGWLWTRRAVVGHGAPEETNERFRTQIEHGVAGLDVICDTPSMVGLDADHPMAEGEIGICGVSISSLEDMELLMAGVPLEKVSTVLLPGGTQCPVVFAAYVALAMDRRLEPSQLRGTISNNPLHLYFCGPVGKTTNPLDLSLKLSVDIIEYCTRHMPQFHSGYSNAYDMRESRISAAQEIAVGFAEEMAYIDGALARGLDIDDFEPRRSMYFSAHTDIFEEAAKLRAARRMWARLMTEKYGAKKEATRKLRFGVHTGGSSLSPQQPLNNIVRVAYQALAAVMGGAQSLHCCSYDEPVAIPTEEAQMIALRTQQILAHEAGAANVADPLGGSYYVEALTDKLEAAASDFLQQIDQRGGFLAVAESGWLQVQMDQATLNFQDEVEAGERVLVGVNAYTTAEEDETPGGVFRVSDQSERLVIERLKRLKATRDDGKLRRAIEGLRQKAAAGEDENLIPAIIDALRAKATKAEIGGIIREAYGYSYDPLGMLENPF